MKYTYINKLCVLASFFLLFSCNESEDIISGDAKEGAYLNIKGSSGQLAGAPDPSMTLDSAVVEFQAVSLEYDVKVSNGEENVSELVVYKILGEQKVEIERGSAEGVSVVYSGIEEFLDGFSSVSSSDLRIGDVVTIRTEIHMKDGRVLIDPTAILNVQVSCLADLSGTYTVTNSWCSSSITVEVTRNADGSYTLTSADGGGLGFCTANAGLMNPGNIVEQCGQILPSEDLEYASLGIGIITGGTWDGENGIITLEHTQDFSPNWPSEWTSTYTRQ